MPHPSPSDANARRSWLPWLLALASFVPLIWRWSDFRELFWFGDEWDQLDQISHVGFWRWTFGCFGENFAPVLKLTWGGLALSSHGSYLFMLVAVWCVHAVCVVLLGRWMLRAGFGVFGTAVTLVTFGLAATNIETLGWTIQLITIQGIAFFLAAAQWQQAKDETRWTSRDFAVLFALVTLSTFSFVRGALTGGSLIVAALAPVIVSAAARKTWRDRCLVALLCLVPAIVSVAVIEKYAPGNHQHLAQVGFRAPAEFALSYYLLNPFYKLVSDGMWTTAALVGFGVAKLAVTAFAFWKATPSQRRLLVPLFVFDVGNALLMGVGRYNQPLITATSSRYQYISLICALPFSAIVLEWALERIAWLPVRRAVAAVVLIMVTDIAVGPWATATNSWAEYRGRNTRQVLFQERNPPAEGAIPGIPFLQTKRAKELVDEYHLH